MGEDYKKLAKKLQALYPFLSANDSLEMIKDFSNYLEFIIDNSENI